MSRQSIQRKLNIARQELLDLGMRNPLLNYRTLKARGLDIVNERPGDVYDILVKAKKKMSFLVREREETTGTRGNTDTEAVAGAPDEAGPEHSPVTLQAYRDAKLQTNYTDIQLQSRLLNTYTAARTYIEEQGVNILYMALGMLEWYESESSQECRRAPLVLVPVQIDRVSARERFTITYTEDEIGHNVSLVARMKNDFGIVLPPLEDEDAELNDYFAKVKAAVEGQNRWLVDCESVVIGFFSFGKFLMYWDLDPDNWPEHSKLLDHPIISALLESGFNEPPSTISDGDHLDKHLKPESSNLIKEADSSQLLAIADANQGRNLVIQGPPGTGKSQTITNLIAEAIGNGKKVLFVSEKMAALEVVKRRLDEVGLGIACLELHSHKTNKKTLLNELANTLDLGRPMSSQSKSAGLVHELIDRLNDYCDALHTPIGHSDVTPYQALGQLTKYKVAAQGFAFPRIRIPLMEEWASHTFTQSELLLDELQSVIRAMGLPIRQPFWGSKKKLFLPHELEELQEAVGAAIKATMTIRDSVAEYATITMFPHTDHLADAALLLKLGRRVLEAPKLDQVNLRSDKWLSAADSLNQLLEAGKQVALIRSTHGDKLIPAAWEQDVLGARQSIVQFQGKWWGFLSGDFRRAKHQIRALFRSPDAKEIDYIGVIDSILDAQHAARVIDAHEGLARELLGSGWNGQLTDWAYLSRLLDWITTLKIDIRDGQVPEWTLDCVERLQQQSNLNHIVSRLDEDQRLFIEAIEKLQVLLEFDGALRFENQGQFVEQPFTDLLDMFGQWSDRVTSVQTLASYNRLSHTCIEQGLRPVIELTIHWEHSADRLVDVFRWNWYEALTIRAFQERSALSQFEGSQHEHAIQKFAELDIDLTHRNRYKLAEAHWRTLPHYDAGGQLGVLRREFEKKTRHLPIRQLMLKAGNAIQAIKPVFMMGPLSIATYIHPGSLEFDLVIFDEASQVKPVDAFGAIIRGKQIVVVGDSKQMPPSNFFDSIQQADGQSEEEDDFVGDMESILGLFVGQNAPQRMLRWHYRSRHESLITVSNHEFYDHKLVVFPSPDADRRESGLVYNYLEHTSYDRGRTRTNKEEAKAVANAVMEHARKTPQLSLGVAAFSMVQMQAVLDELELLRRADASGEPFFAQHPHEPFFVKNLENVQGDERDVILISIGYGKTSEGYMSMDFGALNREGGERRLNVLITRARIRCEVFTNLRSDDIDLNRSGARGVKALKTFLRYADSGILDVPGQTGKALDSPFEEAVYKQLTDAGYTVKPQVGSGGFYIDLAIVDPETPGKFILGIECDGATYHSARSARDRDRLRQQVLVGLGWRIHRIWSADWYRHPERELGRVIEAIKQAQNGSKTGPMQQKDVQLAATSSSGIEIERATSESSITEHDHQESLKYETAEITGIALAGGEFHELPVSDVAAWVLAIVKVESPVHISEVIRRVSEAIGLKRVGTRIQASIMEAVRYLEQRDKLNQMGDFLWIPGMSIPPVRDRSELTVRKLDLIAPQEIAAAIMRVVRETFGIERDHLPQSVCHVLGLTRATDDVKSYVDEVLNRLIAKQHLVEKGSQVSLAG